MADGYDHLSDEAFDERLKSSGLDSPPPRPSLPLMDHFTLKGGKVFASSVLMVDGATSCVVGGYVVADTEEQAIGSIVLNGMRHKPTRTAVSPSVMEIPPRLVVALAARIQGEEKLRDALENLVIHVSMGWELDAVLEAAGKALGVVSDAPSA